MIKAIQSLAVFAVSLGFSGWVNATLINDTVSCSITSGWVCDSATAVVADPGAEFILSEGVVDDWEVDIGANSITVAGIGNLVNVIGSVVLTLGDLDWVDFPTGEIIGIDNLVTNVTGIDLSDISFTAHSVSIELGNSQSWTVFDGGQLSFDLVTNHAVPEPTTLALLSLGLAGLGFTRRRMKA